MKSLLTLIILLAASVAAQRLLSKLLRTLILSHAPLSGDQSDSAVYQRSMLTPADNNNRLVWALTLLAGWLAWMGTTAGGPWALAALPTLLAAVGWELWTWERVAVSVRTVSWRRGWRRSVRKVPVSQIAEVLVVERPHPWLRGEWGHKLGSCYLRLELRKRSAVKLPRTSILRGQAQLEDMANFLRMQMGLADEERRRAARERRAGRPAPDSPLPPEKQEELRRRLVALRREATASARVTGESLPHMSDSSLPETWPPESVPADSQGAESLPPDSQAPDSRPAR